MSSSTEKTYHDSIIHLMPNNVANAESENTKLQHQLALKDKELEIERLKSQAEIKDLKFQLYLLQHNIPLPDDI